MVKKRGVLPCAAVLAAIAALCLGTGCGRKPPKPVDNVILITLDTTRSDALGPYGNRRIHTPALDAMAARGQLFENCYSHAPITLPSHSSILSGMLPTQHGVRNNIAYAFPPTKVTLAERLKAAGFDTGAFVSSFILDHRFGLDAGFDLYEDKLVHYGAHLAKHEIVTRRAATTNDLFLAWMAERKGRFFAWVHFYDAHSPYEPPLPFRQAYADDPYLGEIASMDLEIGRIVRALEQRGLAERTLIVVTADHGESFLEHGEQTHGFFCYASTTHVPLILSQPLYGKPGTHYSHLVQSIDIVPSLLEALGLPADESLDGHSLADRRPREVYAEAMIPQEEFYLAPVHAVRDGEFSFYLSSDQELYDLRRDPGEKTNLISEEPARAKAYEAEVRQRLAAADTSASKTVQMDQESIQLLASLGYIADGGAVLARESDPFRFPSPAHSVRMYRELQRLRKFEDTFPFKTIEGLRGLIAEDRHQVILYRDLGRLSAFAGNEDEALANLGKAAAMKPDDPRLHVFFALGLYRFGKFERSQEELEVALKLDAGNAPAWYNLGLVEIAQDNVDGALAAFGKAVGINSQDILALNNLAYLELTRRKDPERAWSYILEAEAINASHPLIQANKKLIAAAR